MNGGRKIIVVGSSIAGLMTSIALKRKSDVPIRILEKGSRSNRKGTYVGLWTPALACLQSLGLYTPLADAFEPVIRSCYKSKFGRILLEPTNGLRDPRVQPTRLYKLRLPI